MGFLSMSVDPQAWTFKYFASFALMRFMGEFSYLCLLNYCRDSLNDSSTLFLWPLVFGQLVANSGYVSEKS